MCSWSTMSQPGKKSSRTISRFQPKPWIPYKYQEKVIEFCVSRGAGGVFADPGTGKTTIMAAVYQILRDLKQVNNVLVVAPLQPCYNVWSKSHNDSDFVKWIDFQDLSLELIHSDMKGPDSGYRNEMKKREIYEREADFHVINPEGLGFFVDTIITERKDGKGIKKEYRLKKEFQRGKFKFDMLIVDEVTDFKYTNTLRFKRLEKLLNLFDRRYILTGDPAANGLLDLFGQCYILDGGNALGRFISRYKRDFFEPTLPVYLDTAELNIGFSAAKGGDIATDAHNRHRQSRLR